MINAYELSLLSQLQNFWTNTIVPNIGGANDVVNDVFASLPATGDFGANWAAIDDVLTKMSTGNTTDDLEFLLQFPTIRAHVPCVTVEVGPEEEMEVIGSSVQEDLNTQTAKWEVQKGGVFNKRYAVGVYTFNSDTTLYLYSIVKYAIILLRDSLPDASNYAISARPLQIDSQRFTPDVVYFRYIDISVEGLIDTVVERFGQVKSDVAVPIPVPPSLSIKSSS
jgi:hypothetical protein